MPQQQCVDTIDHCFSPHGAGCRWISLRHSPFPLARYSTGTAFGTQPRSVTWLWFHVCPASFCKLESLNWCYCWITFTVFCSGISRVILLRHFCHSSSSLWFNTLSKQECAILPAAFNQQIRQRMPKASPQGTNFGLQCSWMRTAHR